MEIQTTTRIDLASEINLSKMLNNIIFRRNFHETKQS